MEIKIVKKQCRNCVKFSYYLPNSGKCSGHTVNVDGCCGKYKPAKCQQIIERLMFENRNRDKYLELELKVARMVHGPQYEFSELPSIFDNSVEVIYGSNDKVQVKSAEKAAPEED